MTHAASSTRSTVDTSLKETTLRACTTSQSPFLLARLYNQRAQYFSKVSSSWMTEDIWPPFTKDSNDGGGVIVGWCDGLFCLEYDDGKYVLWNPSSKDYKVLPLCDIEAHPCHLSHGDGEGCIKASRVSHVRWLGFDSTCEDYKFVQFISTFYDDEDEPYRCHSASSQVAIYSLKNDSWKEIQHPGKFDIYDGAATCVDGSCYWKANKGILKFDFSIEEFSTLPYPDIMKGVHSAFGQANLALLEYAGSLLAVIYPRFGIVKSFTFWTWNCCMENGGGYWSSEVKFNVHLAGVLVPLGFSSFDSAFLFQGIHGHLLKYDFIKKELKSIFEIFDYPQWMRVFPYIMKRVKFLNGNKHIEEEEEGREKETKRKRNPQNDTAKEKKEPEKDNVHTDDTRSVKNIAMGELRSQDLGNEILNSERLKAHFQDDPKDLDLLKHDKVLSNKEPAAHVPEHLLDPTTKEDSKIVKLARAAMGNAGSTRRKGLKGKFKKSRDP